MYFVVLSIDSFTGIPFGLFIVAETTPKNMDT